MTDEWVWFSLLFSRELESDDAPLPDWEGTRPVEDCTSIVGNLATITSKRERRRFLSSAENRQALVLGPRVNSPSINQPIAFFFTFQS
jgi:hypothetical protein